jgi:hypothetical protein
MINFKNLTLATCIGAMSILLAACSDSESTGTTTAKNSAPAKANEAKEPVNPEAPVVMSLPAYELQEDLSVYWEVNNGTEAAFIYNGKAAEPDSIDTIVKSLANGNYFRGTEKLSELFEQYSKTHDEFVKKDLEKTITPLLQEQLEKFGKQPYYKQTLRSNFISMKPYDFEKEEFPLGSDLFVSIEQI